MDVIRGVFSVFPSKGLPSSRPYGIHTYMYTCTKGGHGIVYAVPYHTISHTSILQNEDYEASARTVHTTPVEDYYCGRTR